MYNKILLLCFSLCFGVILKAQELTYAEDHAIVKILEDLGGYDVYPAKVQLASERFPTNIKLGWTYFKFRADHIEVLERVHFKPGGISKQPLNVEPMRWAIETDWSNVRSAGRLKFELYNPDNRKHKGMIIITLDGISQIKQLEYYPDRHKSTPRVYFLAKTPKTKKVDYSMYFTHEKDYEILKMDDYWGKTLYPFIEIKQPKSFMKKRIVRLYEEDRISIRFKVDTIQVGKKEKEQEFIIFKVKDNEGALREEKFQIKKHKLLSQKKTKKSPNTPSKVMQLKVFKPSNPAVPYTVYIKRGVGYRLRSIELVEEKANKILYFFKFRNADRTKPVVKD